MSETQKDFEVEEVDVEEFVKLGVRLPHAKVYRIRIDRDKYLVAKAIVTKADLLLLAGKSPEKWRVYQKFHGGHLGEVKDGEAVDLRAHGVERFVTMELSQTDGESAVETPQIRRAFRLPEEDEGYLNSLGLSWETLREGSALYVLIHDHPVPDGFVQSTVTIGVRIDGGYPPAKLDMAYFMPALSKSNGKCIPAVTIHRLDSEQFQCWSRHYQWREEIDNLETHHLKIKQWLLDELNR